MRRLVESEKMNKVIGINLVKKRKERGWTQKEMRSKLVEFLATTDVPSEMTISAYENGTRTMNAACLVAFARLFGCSVDELVGYAPGMEIELKRMEERAENTGETEPHFHPGYQIEPSRYADYDQEPVFMAPIDGMSTPKWGILDYSRMRVCCAGMTIQLSPELRLYAAKPDAFEIPIDTYKKLSMVALMKANNIYVESFSSNREIRGYVTGYYTHSPNRAFLVNTANGMTLPYQGLGISYAAYEIIK